jgi:hypothetical protein
MAVTFTVTREHVDRWLASNKDTYVCTGCAVALALKDAGFEYVNVCISRLYLGGGKGVEDSRDYTIGRDLREFIKKVDSLRENRASTELPSLPITFTVFPA